MSKSLMNLPDARTIVAASVAMLPAERIPISRAFRRLLREPLRASEDMPAFNRSAMDGYAIRREDPATEFQVIEEIPAGMIPTRTIGRGQCARVFTGAAIPACADQVVIQECATRSGDAVTFSERSSGSNIRYRGEDAREGDVLLHKGVSLGPIELSLFAQLGVVEPLVSPRPRLLHIVSGSELVGPESGPGPGQIRDSNSTMTSALAQGSDCDVIAQHRVGDDLAALVKLVAAHERDAWNALLLSGGAGPGEHDFGAKALNELGFTIRFQNLNLRPGKPLIFATRGAQFAFVIPGNPLAHFVCWHVLIQSAIDMLIRGEAAFPLVNVELGGERPLSGHARETWWPARLSWSDGAKLHPLKWQSSGDLTGLGSVDALIRVPSNSPLLTPGSPVEARLVGRNAA